MYVEAFQRTKKARKFVSIQTKVVAARDSVARLEQAMTAIGDINGAEMEVMVSAFKRLSKMLKSFLQTRIRAREAFVAVHRFSLAQFCC